MDNRYTLCNHFPDCRIESRRLQRIDGTMTQTDDLRAVLPCIPDPFDLLACRAGPVIHQGTIFTRTLLYLDKAGVPLSVTFKMKCAVSALLTTGAVTQTPRAFSAELMGIHSL